MIHLFGMDAAAADLRRAQRYRDIIIRQARVFVLPSATVAGIGSRETHWSETCGGVANWLGDPEKMPDGTIHWHGCGPLQVDDRTDPEFCTAWKAGRYDVETGIHRGLQILIEKVHYFQRFAPSADPSMVMRLSIAAYNCGQVHVQRAYVLGTDPDMHTMPHDGRTPAERTPWKSGDYSKDVLQRADYFRDNGFASSAGDDSWGAG